VCVCVCVCVLPTKEVNHPISSYAWRRREEEEEEEEEEEFFNHYKNDLKRHAHTLDEEERGLIKDLKRRCQLAVAWDRHGSPVPRWTCPAMAWTRPLHS